MEKSNERKLSDNVSTHIRDGFRGWQAGFTVQQQTLFLQAVSIEKGDDEDTEEKAKWLQGCLDDALNKIIKNEYENMGHSNQKPEPPNKNDYNFGYGHNQADNYKRDLEMYKKRVKEDMICPETGKHCDDECCKVGSECNLSGRQSIVDATNKEASVDNYWYCDERGKLFHIHVCSPHDLGKGIYRSVNKEDVETFVNFLKPEPSSKPEILFTKEEVMEILEWVGENFTYAEDGKWDRRNKRDQFKNNKFKK